MSLQAIKEKMKNLEGSYAFNFANDSDCEYFLEQYGGEKKFQEEYPKIYNSYLKTKEKALASNGLEPKTYSINWGEPYIEQPAQIKNTFNTLSVSDNSDFVTKIKSAITGQFIDINGKISDNENPAKPWTVNLQVDIWDETKKSYLKRYNEHYPSINSLAQALESNKELYSKIKNKSYKITATITATDPEGMIYQETYKRNFTVDKLYPIKHITVNDPVAKTKKPDGSEEIIMLYGRNNQQEIFNYADYRDGDYLNNAFSNGKVHLLMPLKGEIGIDINYTAKGLEEPNDKYEWGRPSVSYDYKDQLRLYRNDLNDKDLYERIKNCFGTPIKEQNVTRVQFDIKYDEKDGRSVLDWHHDVEGVQDGNPKKIMLGGGFSYEADNNETGNTTFSQITIESIDKKELDALGRKYYDYELGSDCVYIPPIIIYWGCFGKDTKIRLAEGSERKACELKIGDELIDHIGRKLKIADIVTGQDTYIYRIKTDKGETKVSGGHPMMRAGEFARASKLKKGDKLNIHTGEFAVVENVEIVEYNDTVYNFTFEDMEEGTYLIADGFYSGDLKLQNRIEEKKKYMPTQEEEELIAEMKKLHARTR